ncbi:MAG: P44/Msp2 family outer membrane protein [Pseudomonadota bacterium]
MSRYIATSVAAISAVCLSAPGIAAAQDFYVSGSVGAGFLTDSGNSGSLSSDFTTGAGTTIPAGTALPAGTGVGWDTEFDAGFAISAAVGQRLIDNVRGELEIAYQSNDVDTHTDVAVGGGAIGTEDAAVLISGQNANLGVSVGDLVADGQGSVETIYLMANIYYDFEVPGAPLKPYVGGGLGVGFVDVDYSPSNTPIVDDDASVFAYQVMAGAAFELTPLAELYGGYRYRGTTDVETDVSLFPATLDIENQSHIVEAGVRFFF